MAKGNSPERNARRTQSRASTPSALERVRQAAQARQETAVHRAPAPRLRRRPLADGLPRAEARRGRRRRRRDVASTTGEQLEANLQDLSERLKRGAYRAKPVRRAYIAKADGRQRPLGVPALEDKIVQRAVVEVLNAIYEHGLPRLLVRIPPRAQPASRAGCADGGDRDEDG